MYKYIKLIFIVIAITSCGKKFLDRESEYYSDKKDAYSSLQGLQSALNGCYDGLQDYRYYGRNFILIPEIYADNAKLSSTNLNNFSSFYNFSLTAGTSELEGFWEIGYKIISRTNNIIDASDKLSTVSYSQKKQILGEAYAIRALVYFDLTRVFAQSYGITSGVDSANGAGNHVGIPLVVKSLKEDSLISPSRNKVQQIYNQIINDLNKADTMLPNRNTEPYTFSSNAVKALLARVYMSYGSAGGYLLANQYASKVISSGEYKLVAYNNYIDSWSLPYSSETILSLSYSSTDNLGSNALGFMLSKAGYGDIVASDDLYALYSEKDIRKQLFKKGKDIFVSKYPGRLGVLGIDNIPILRLSEMYLIKAEALVRLGFTNPAQKAYVENTARLLMDTLQKRVNLNAIPLKLEDKDLLEYILQERRKELAFEGHRFFDIKRQQKPIERNSCQSSVCYVTNPNYLFALPIPTSELNANPNLKQNPGY